MELVIKDLCFSYREKNILRNINLRLKPMVTAVIGPNGAGKSTLIKCIAGSLKHRGAIWFNGNEVGPSYKEFYTKVLSYLPQAASNDAAITVFEAVLLGMLSSLSLRVSSEETEKVLSVLEDLEIQGLAHRYMNELSGGQQQMVSMAQAIIKEPQVILLDEPLNSLDIHHQFEILNLISELTYNRQMITVIAMHDLNLAARYADCIVIVKDGEIYGCGEPMKVLTPEIIRAVYQVDAEVFAGSDGIPVVDLVDVVGHSKLRSRKYSKNM